MRSTFLVIPPIGDEAILMTAPPDMKIVGPQLTTRQGALFGVVDIELVDKI